MKQVNPFSCRLALILIICGFSSLGRAQTNSFQLDDLSGRTWVMQGLTDKTSNNKYSEMEITLFLDGNKLGAFEYYLSDSIVTKFDTNKVGIVKVGKYIVRRLIPDPSKTDAPQPQVLSVFEIIELDHENLVIRNIKQNHHLKYKVN